METTTHKEATEAYAEIINNGLMPCFEVGESVIYIEPSEKGWAFGTACNCGLLKDGEFEFDPDFSTDENLQECLMDIESHYGEA